MQSLTAKSKIKRSVKKDEDGIYQVVENWTPITKEQLEAQKQSLQNSASEKVAEITEMIEVYDNLEKE